AKQQKQKSGLFAKEVAQPLLSWSVEVGSKEKVDGNVTRKPVSIYFVIDTTTSMDPVINTITENIVDFARYLESREFEPRYGGVAFKDEVDESKILDLTDSPETFYNYVSGLQTGGGGRDAQEGGLAAVSRAVSLLHNQETRKNALEVVLYFSDSPAHQ